MGIISWIKHKLRMNTGYCESFYNKKGELMMGFRCECGGLHNIFRVPGHVEYPELYKKYWKNVKLQEAQNDK